eukprot:2234452-Amphidinium_carterae.2
MATSRSSMGTHEHNIVLTSVRHSHNDGTTTTAAQSASTMHANTIASANGGTGRGQCQYRSTTSS